MFRLLVCVNLYLLNGAKNSLSNFQNREWYVLGMREALPPLIIVKFLEILL